MNSEQIASYIKVLEDKVRRYEEALDVYYRMGNWKGNRFLVEKEGWHLANKAMFPKDGSLNLKLPNFEDASLLQKLVGTFERTKNK